MKKFLNIKSAIVLSTLVFSANVYGAGTPEFESLMTQSDNYEALVGNITPLDDAQKQALLLEGIQMSRNPEMKDSVLKVTRAILFIKFPIVKGSMLVTESMLASASHDITLLNNLLDYCLSSQISPEEEKRIWEKYNPNNHSTDGFWNGTLKPILHRMLQRG